jgi:hypothetical protein
MNVIYHKLKGGNFMNYKIWNKKDKINNIDADYFIKDLSIRESDGVFLVLDNLEEVQAIEIDRIIKGVYNLDANLTVEEVAQEYIRIKEEEKLQASRQASNMEEQTIKISNLETSILQMMQELKDLKEIVAKSLEK